MTVLRQTWCISAVLLIFLCNGLTSFASYRESQADRSTFYNTWCGVFTTIGYLASSSLMDVIGRQYTYILGVLPGLISCLLKNSPDNHFESLESALSGLSFGSTSILGLIIIAEYTSPKYRTVFLNMTTSSMYAGYMISSCISSQMQNATVFLFNLSVLLQVLSLSIILTWPKSPYWLALKGRYEECKASFELLRGTDEMSNREKKDLLSRITSHQSNTLLGRVCEFCKTYVKGDFRRFVALVVFGAILAEASGRHYLPIFAENIIAKMANENPSSNLYISILIALSSIFSCVLLGIYSNRRLLIASGVSLVTAMFFGSIYILLLTNNAVPPSSWMLVMFVVSQVVFSNLGATSIPIALIGEVFPLEYKAAGSLLAGLVTSTVSWGAVSIASSLLASFHVFGTLAVFGLMLTVSLLFVSVILPETKGKTLLEIQESFNSELFGDDEDLEILA